MWKIRNVTFTMLALLYSSNGLASTHDNNNNEEVPKSIVAVQDVSQNDCLPLPIQKNLKLLGYMWLNTIAKAEDLSGLLHQPIPNMPELLAYETLYAPKYAALTPTLFIRNWFSSSDETYNTERKNRMLAIICIMWALNDMADKQGDSFQRGSFTIIDPQHRLSTFFLDYVRLVTRTKDPKQLSYFSTISNYAYRRDPDCLLSTHHKGRCPESQFGIDIRFETGDGVRKLLPFGSTHVLFAPLVIDGNQEEDLLFIKPEEIGMGEAGAIVAHSISLGHSTMADERTKRREKDILPNIQEAFVHLQKLSRTSGKLTTIRAMSLVAKNLTNHEDLEIVTAANQVLEAIAGHYPADNNDVRVGNEVILDLDKLEEPNLKELFSIL